jgi:hypothetical protein
VFPADVPLGCPSLNLSVLHWPQGAEATREGRNDPAAFKGRFVIASLRKPLLLKGMVLNSDDFSFLDAKH